MKIFKKSTKLLATSSSIIAIIEMVNINGVLRIIVENLTWMKCAKIWLVKLKFKAMFIVFLFFLLQELIMVEGWILEWAVN